MEVVDDVEMKIVTVIKNEEWRPVKFRGQFERCKFLGIFLI